MLSRLHARPSSGPCHGEVATSLRPMHHWSTYVRDLPRISFRRLNCDFYINQVLTGHGTLGDHQARLRNNLPCPCGAPVTTIQQCLYMARDGGPYGKPTSRGTTRFECLKTCVSIPTRKGVIAIINDLFDWTLSNTKSGNLRRMGAACSHSNSVIPSDSNAAKQCFER